MKYRIGWLAQYYGSWVLFFVVARAIFLAYHSLKTSELNYATIGGVFAYGLRLDLSFAAYLSLLPGLLLCLPLKPRTLAIILKAYQLIWLVLLSLLIITDLEAYEAWGFRFDATPLRYLQNPQEAWASAGASPISLLLGIGMILFGLSWWWFGRVRAKTLRFSGVSGKIAVAMLLATVVLIIPLRGGLGLPLNQSAVYFSTSVFANHAATNVAWNFASSVVNRTYQKQNPFVYLPESQAKTLLRPLFAQDTTQRTPRLLKSNSIQPNVLFIVWESLTAKVVARLGGQPNVTPQLEQLCSEGVLFSQCYASGDRSDKGLVAILSGYPAQPIGSIMTMPDKTIKLPALSKSLGSAGYQTAFYYGGDPTFANIKSYLLSAGMQRIVSIDDFPQTQRTTEWGVHDHLVFRRLAQDLSPAKRPFFWTYFTLSSHEPFDVPVPPHFEGNDKATAFKNAHRYTDQSLGEFITEAKQQDWWDNTLVVVVADHGHWLPAPDQKVANFHIPMLWLGGVLAKRDTVINTIMGQNDIAATLLSELGLSQADYGWSRDALHPTTQSFAYFAFHNGFGLIQPQGQYVFDDEGKRIIFQKGKVSTQDLRRGQAYQQLSYDDFLKK